MNGWDSRYLLNNLPHNIVPFLFARTTRRERRIKGEREAGGGWTGRVDSDSSVTYHFSDNFSVKSAAHSD